MSKSLRYLKEAQLAWARRAQMVVDEQGYTLTLKDNLHLGGLKADTRNDFEAGDGGELGREGERGKMQALHSSSVLCVNAFDYWRGGDTTRVAGALGILPGMIRFEQRFPTGVGPLSPNLDVTIEHVDNAVTAIESKFLEPYSSSKRLLAEKYIVSGPGRWGALGLRRCEVLARKLAKSAKLFQHLDAPQLLKHILGLATQRIETHWTLLYLWFATPLDDSNAHDGEIKTFSECIARDPIDFRALTYQEFLARLLPTLTLADEAYREYMASRYAQPENRA